MNSRGSLPSDESEIDSDEPHNASLRRSLRQQLYAQGVTFVDPLSQLLKEVKAKFPNSADAEAVATFAFECLSKSATVSLPVKLSRHTAPEEEPVIETNNEEHMETKKNDSIGSREIIKGVKSFFHHDVRRFQRILEDIEPPMFSSVFKGSQNTKIKFSSTYNKFMEKYVCLLAIIASFSISSEQLDNSNSNEGDTDFHIDVERVVTASREIVIFKKMQSDNTDVSKMSPESPLPGMYIRGESRFGNAITNIKSIVGNAIVAGKKSSPMRDRAIEFLNSAGEGWIEIFFATCAKDKQMGIWKDSEDYENTFLWYKFSDLLNSIVYE